MLIKNYELNFKFEINDDFSEIKQSSYAAFGVGPNTLHYFVQLDDNGEINKVLSLCKDEECESEEEVKALIKKNIEQVKEVGFNLISENDFETHAGRKIYRKVFVNEETKGIYVMYFTMVHKTLVTSSTEILEPYDEYEEEMYAIFATMEDI